MDIEWTYPKGVNLVPPREMIYDGSSSPEEFVVLGENFCRYILIPRAHLEPAAAILDLGCGNGAVARALTGFLSPAGRYEGLDVNAQSITWLREQYKGYPNFRFTHADVHNRLYNPTGRHQPREYRLPFQDATFDVLLLKSVFTHMLPEDVSAYLKEVSRVLKQAGRAVVTFFLLNDESRRFLEGGGGRIAIRFEHGGDPLCLVLSPELPESAVSHDENRIRQYFRDAGLSPTEIVYGDWCGRTSMLGLQDFVIALKE